MSDDGRIAVESFSVNEERQPPCYGLNMGTAWYRPTFRASVELVMDEAGMERFLAAMEAAIPGFHRPKRHRPEPARALPETTRALPSGPLEAEFVDE